MNLNMTPVNSSDVNLDSTAGKASIIQGIAAELKQDTDEKSLVAISERLKSMKMIRPPMWNHPSRGRKTSVEILRDGAWGCSAHAQVACHLARACGIPAILAKSVNVDWIERGNRGDGRAEGHVYVEVLLDENRCLWDAQGGALYKNYDPSSRRTPEGTRMIYDKGGPDAVVLSHHGHEWEDETKRFFSGPGTPPTFSSPCL